jgi:hypothetical protein
MRFMSQLDDVEDVGGQIDGRTFYAVAAGQYVCEGCNCRKLFYRIALPSLQAEPSRCVISARCSQNKHVPAAQLRRNAQGLAVVSGTER